MARSSAVLVLIFLLASSNFVSNAEGSNRKVLITRSSMMEINISLRSVLKKLFLGAIAHSRAPPSNKGRATLGNEKLFRIHLGRIDRILQSVPSPGAGH
ncbi:hypothetical protein K2173_006550 [Erythroxylum novogranatense]|uniref:Uncharacterized protein n=1 Tax=Erythroxylum novogranatense TaxID=1862640 RepID=A0AAV8T6X7_9ROSI|nr:hypothetical protein K2173_006550 [Erythroxylum novogranatense]